MTIALPARACGIDFGTSNSTVGWLRPDQQPLIALEDDKFTLPSVVFFNLEERRPVYGRLALHEYLEGYEGRLLRSLKSLLGSKLLKSETAVLGSALPFKEILGLFLGELKKRAEAVAGRPFEEVVLGRPVFFVDDDPQADREAADTLSEVAKKLGFKEVSFQYEPIAAAFDYESAIEREELVLIVDIGGGTSDFSLVRVGPSRRGRLDRRDDILASHGVHVAGTDFDRHVELTAILPLLGHRTLRRARPGEAAREMPSGLYFDLATWHLINTVYAPARLAEVRQMRDWFADPAHHRRLLRVLQARLGHALAAAAEQAKIDVATQGLAEIDLDEVESGLAARLDEPTAGRAIEADLQRIVEAARETVRLAGLEPAAVDTLYFTGGSTGLAPLVARIGTEFSAARMVRGDRFASVAHGLGVHARQVFGGEGGRPGRGG